MTRWTEMHGDREKHAMWSVATDDVASALRSLANALEADDKLVLYTVSNLGDEMQAFVGRMS